MVIQIVLGLPMLAGGANLLRDALPRPTADRSPSAERRRLPGHGGELSPAIGVSLLVVAFTG